MTVAAQVAPIAFTLLAWWLATGAILYLDGLPRHTFRWSLAAASGVLACALWGLYQTRHLTSAAGAYCAFSCALVVWGWLEMSFLMGYVTGPRVSICPAGSRGWQKAGFALQTVLHHELALLAALLVVAALGYGADNRFGLWTFAILWISRQSAKLNIFLGARNLSEELLPEHLRYLQTYFTRRSMNPLFPVSVALTTLAAAWLGRESAAAATDFGFTGFALLTTLTLLALIEHGFLMLPVPSNRLWQWALRSRQPEPAGGGPAIEAKLL